MPPARTGLLLSTAYFPPISYFALIAGCNSLLIEKHENYSKQSYRNRCCIMTANSQLQLVIPVRRKKGEKTPITDIRPDYSYPWQKLHRISVISAYRSAPFYEYYIDALMPFFENRYALLTDLNSAILGCMLNILDIDIVPRYTNSFIHFAPPGIADMRDKVHPKKKPGNHLLNIGYPEYQQVFSDRHGFMPNLSILDLVFNTGPDAGSYIRRVAGLMKPLPE